MSTERNIAFVTLGCAKNEVDTDKMKARLSAAGFAIVDNVDDAACVVVNTCSFLTSAVEESIDTIFDLVRSLEEDNEDSKEDSSRSAKILVAGCMPARYGQALADELTEVDGFLSPGDEEYVVEKVEDLLALEPLVESAHLAQFKSKTRCEQGPSAYVKISDGCNRFCSYCMIPYIRGRYHSYSLESIEAEVAELVDDGAREIVLIGQNTGIWGHDLTPAKTTAQLLECLAGEHPEVWFRLLYVQPGGVTDELLQCMASHENVCSYIDIPLQHADPQVLKAMNRSGSAEEFLELLDHARKMVPGLVTRTTLIAGFPQETQEQFEALLDFVDDARFDYAGVFPYSPEDGSAAAKLPGQIDDEVRLSRAQQLMDACEAVGRVQAAAKVGSEVDVIVEGYELTDVGLEALCRWQGQAPEVDGQVHVPCEKEDDLPIGTVATVRITDSFFYELEGELVYDER